MAARPGARGHLSRQRSDRGFACNAARRRRNTGDSGTRHSRAVAPVHLNKGNPFMKRLILALSLAVAALAGCAELKTAFHQPDAHSGASGLEEQRPYAKSSSDLGLL